MYHVRPYDGVVQMLDSLKKKGIKIAVFSNKPHLQAIDVVESTFGKGYFDHIQGQSGEFPKKPDPEGLLWILDKLGVSPEEGIYIGDSDVDMKTGKSCRYVYSRSRMGIPELKNFLWRQEQMQQLHMLKNCLTIYSSDEKIFL